MLENRGDASHRLHKYTERGFASVLPGELSPRARTLRFLDITNWFDADASTLTDAGCAIPG